MRHRMIRRGLKQYIKHECCFKLKVGDKQLPREDFSYFPDIFLTTVKFIPLHFQVVGYPYNNTQ